MLRSASNGPFGTNSHEIDKPTGDTLPHMTTRTRPRRASDRGSPLEEIVTAALEDMKAVNVKVMDVRHLTDITDIVIIASGNSDRHVKSIADRVVQMHNGQIRAVNADDGGLIVEIVLPVSEARP